MNRFYAGVVAKTRIIELGSDIVNSLSGDLLPRFHTIEQLLSEPFTDEKRALVKKESNFICVNFTAEKIVKRHLKQRSHARLSDLSNNVTTSPGPKTESLLHEVCEPDCQLMQRVVLATSQWQLLSADAERCRTQLVGLVAECKGTENLMVNSVQ